MTVLQYSDSAHWFADGALTACGAKLLRSRQSGRLTVSAVPIQQGRTLQLWIVDLTNTDGKTVARGQVRLANQPLARPS